MYSLYNFAITKAFKSWAPNFFWWFARALAHRAREYEKLLVRQENLLVLDDQMGVLSRPVTIILSVQLW